MTKEALKLALEALKNGKEVRDGGGGTVVQPVLEDAAINAIKAALAQPVQGSLSNGFWVVEVVDTAVNAWPLSQEALLKIALGTEDVSLIPHKPEQPEQAPVAWADIQKKAQQIVESKFLWKKFIVGTPLSNDIACWMADFAQQYTKLKEKNT